MHFINPVHGGDPLCTLHRAGPVLYGALSSPKQKLFLPFVLSWLAARPAAAVATGPHHLAAVAVDVVAAAGSGFQGPVRGGARWFFREQ